MSSAQPPEPPEQPPGQPPEQQPGQQPEQQPHAEPEILAGPGTSAGRGGRGKLVALGVGVAAVAAIVGAAAWGVAQLLGGGPAPATALPASSLAYAAIDLDPSAGQKIEAVRTLNKFPALEDQLDIGSRDDVRRWFLDKIQQEDACSGLDYDTDIKPWIGNELGIAAVPSDDHVADPVFALQVSDQAKAEAGIDTLFEKCAGGDHGVAFVDDFMLVAPTTKIAAAAAADAREHPLSDDPGYQDAVDSIGDPGIVTVYVAKEGPRALVHGFLQQMMGGPNDEMCQGMDLNSLPPTDDPQAKQYYEQLRDYCSGNGSMLPGTGDTEKQLEESLKDFQGAAATLRFADGGVELELGSRGASSDVALGREAAPTGDLPASTVAAVGVSFPKDWAQQLSDRLESMYGAQAYRQLVDTAEKATGLQLPDDLQTLLGDNVVVAVDGSTDWEAVRQSDDPSVLKAGVRVSGDVEGITAIVDRLVAVGGPEVKDIVKIRSDDDAVAVGFDEDYLDQILSGGRLGDSDRYQDAVPDADKAPFVAFVDFDGAGGWLDRLVADDAEAAANVKPLEALGLAVWVDEDVSHLKLRLSTD